MGRDYYGVWCGDCYGGLDGIVGDRGGVGVLFLRGMGGGIFMGLGMGMWGKGEGIED